MISRTLLEKIAAHLYATMIGLSILLGGLVAVGLLGAIIAHHPISILVITIGVMGWAIGLCFTLYCPDD